VLFNLEVMPQFGVGTVVNSARFATKSLPNMPDLHTFVAELYAALDAGQAPPEGTRGTDGRTVMQVLEQVWERMPAPAAPPAQAELTPAAAKPAPRSRIEHRVADAGVGGKVLVTGAAGYLGRHLVAALHRCGADVRALVRDAGRVPAEVRSQAEVVFGNLVDEDAVRRAMEGVDLVVHCAAVTTNNVPWTVHQQTNVDGTRVVYEAARAAGVKRLVHISSVIVYGTAPQTNGNGNGAVAESTPYPAEPDRWAYYLRSKVAAEQVVRDAPDGGPEVVVLRPGLIYGPGAEGPVTKGLVQLGSVRLTLGRGRNALPLTYVDNVVDGILLALVSPNAAGGAFNLVDDPQPRAREAARQADAVAQGGVRFVGLPPAPLKALASRLEAKAAEANAETPPKLSNFQIASATRDVRYATTRAREDLGWEPEIGLEEGLRRTLG
jgi:nucleoside-diphosphate-sugar epimerase